MSYKTPYYATLPSRQTDHQNDLSSEWQELQQWEQGDKSNGRQRKHSPEAAPRKMESKSVRIECEFRALNKGALTFKKVSNMSLEELKNNF